MRESNLPFFDDENVADSAIHGGTRTEQQTALGRPERAHDTDYQSPEQALEPASERSGRHRNRLADYLAKHPR